MIGVNMSVNDLGPAPGGAWPGNTALHSPEPCGPADESIRRFDSYPSDAVTFVRQR